ncbi:MAG: ROK family protein, partial [Vicinamibacterales bacterium]
MFRIGIDLGGTKIEAVGLAADGSERFRQRVDTPRGDYDATVQAIVDLVIGAETAAGEPAS